MGYPPENVPVTLASIIDGTSNTAIFSEWVKGKNLGTLSAGLRPGLLRRECPTAREDRALQYQQACNASTKIAYSQKGIDWLLHSCGKGGGIRTS